MSSGVKLIAVSIHDVEPATYERCALIRDWLEDHGVDRATLLVVPASDLHPFSDRRPDLVEWLRERRANGDAIAQNGMTGGPLPEFPRLDARDTVTTVDTGRRLLRMSGIDPRGFVAPAYAYTPQLHDVVADRFEWWASRTRIHQRADNTMRAPALGLGMPARLNTAGGRVLRLDLHPSDFDRVGHVRRLERVLRRNSRRTAVSYDDLLL